MRKIRKERKWVPYELNERQQENRKTISKMLSALYERKSFLYRIVTKDEKWIFLENPKLKKSWVDPDQPSTSTARDQEGVIYYELFKPSETINVDRYR